jgi:signal transduction histidine kinase
LRGAVAVGRDVHAEHLLAQTQGDWLAVAAHDLRAPVTAILGNVQLARRSLAAAVRRAEDPSPGSSFGTGSTTRAGDRNGREPVPLPRLLRHVETAETGIRELLRTMETLLDASAAAAGGLVGRLDPGGVDLGAVAERAVEHARALTRRHALTLHRPPLPLTVAGDMARLRQLFDNLLANAVKFAPDGGSIVISLERAEAPPDAAGADPTAGPWALVRVADEGLGIPVADLPRVFDRYYRADGAARLVHGTGLGLYTCRAIAAAHGGHIWIERTAVAPEPEPIAAETSGDEDRDAWHGTVVALALPLASGPAPATNETADAATVSAVITEEG